MEVDRSDVDCFGTSDSLDICIWRWRTGPYSSWVEFPALVASLSVKNLRPSLSPPKATLSVRTFPAEQIAALAMPIVRRDQRCEDSPCILYIRKDGLETSKTKQQR